MGDEEAARFEASPLFKAALKMRTFDEAAKVVGMTLPCLDSFSDRVGALLASAKSGADVPIVA